MLNSRLAQPGPEWLSTARAPRAPFRARSAPDRLVVAALLAAVDARIVSAAASPGRLPCFWRSPGPAAARPDSAPASEDRETMDSDTTYRTRGGLTVHRHVEAADPDLDVAGLVDALDERRGALYSSSYE